MHASSIYFKHSLLRLLHPLAKESYWSFCREELAEVYGKLMQGRPFAFVEDPFAEDDWEPARQFTAKYDIEVGN